MKKTICFLLFALFIFSGCTQRAVVPNETPINENVSNPVIAPTPVLEPQSLPEPPSPPPSQAENILSKSVVENETISGVLETSQTWKGEILIENFAEVPEGITLTIKPGTKVKFKHNRDYKNPAKGALQVSGTLKAIGKPGQLIYFTSDAPSPQNGDWGMIRLFGKNGSQISYAVVEFAQQGINLWQSDAIISHSIVRWNNWEGLYAESYSTPTIEYNRVYQNGYNGMAMEQFNNAIVRFNRFEKSGTHGLHVDASKALVENNILSENNAAGLSLDNASEVTAKNNTIQSNHLTDIMCGEGENRLHSIGNVFEKENCPAGLVENTPGVGAAEINFDYPIPTSYDLGYTPGDREKDKYLYVYPTDETRKIVKKIGDGLGLTWSLAWDNKTKTLWTSNLSGDIYHLDPITGKILKQFKAPSSQPWGMAFDGTTIWITDFAEKRTYSLDPQTGKELFSFQNPDQEHGAKGLEWDGTHLNVMGWTTNTVYQVDRTGKLVKEIPLDYGAGGGLTWDGQHFWAPCDGICKFSKEGKLTGKIYPASEGTWDLAWEPANNSFGGYLWASQRTNENWYDDAKLFKLEILDDKIALGPK